MPALHALRMPRPVTSRQSSYQASRSTDQVLSVKLRSDPRYGMTILMSPSQARHGSAQRAATRPQRVGRFPQKNHTTAGLAAVHRCGSPQDHGGQLSRSYNAPTSQSLTGYAYLVEAIHALCSEQNYISNARISNARTFSSKTWLLHMNMSKCRRRRHAD